MAEAEKKYNGYTTYYFLIDKTHNEKNIADYFWAEVKFYKSEYSRSLIRENYGVTEQGEFAIAIPAVLPEELMSWNSTKQDPELKEKLRGVIEENFDKALDRFDSFIKMLSERSKEIRQNGFYDVENGKEHDFDIRAH